MAPRGRFVVGRVGREAVDAAIGEGEKSRIRVPELVDALAGVAEDEHGG